MEKYRKFDDPSNGLNPFTPLEVPKKLTGWKKNCRSIISVFLPLLRIPMVTMGLAVLFCLHGLKYLFVFPRLVRWMEYFADNLIGELIMTTLAY